MAAETPRVNWMGLWLGRLVNVVRILLSSRLLTWEHMGTSAPVHITETHETALHTGHSFVLASRNSAHVKYHVGFALPIDYLYTRTFV